MVIGAIVAVIGVLMVVGSVVRHARKRHAAQEYYVDGGR